MITEKARIEEIAAKARDASETHSIPWQNSRTLLKVINISVDSVLLNPASHRIRSQIESHQNAHDIHEDPFAEDAQDLIAEMLKETLGYNALLESLRESGQIETGIITYTGVLINANTRLVAMRELEEDYIRVAVLPESATESEITELEARLQLAKDYKQDYTLTNELLFIKEQIDLGTSKEDLAILLGKAQSRNRTQLNKGIAEIEQSIRILQHIREMQHASGGDIRLTFFDDHESALTEADNAYTALRDKNLREAERVRDGRMAGVLIGVTYRNLRNWDNDSFVKGYLEPRLEEEVELVESLFAGESQTADSAEQDRDNGLDVFEDQEERKGTQVDPTNMLELVAGMYGKEDDEEVCEGVTKLDFYGRLQDCITQAAEDREQEKRDERRQSTPVRLIKEARQRLDRAREAIERLASQGANRGKLEYELRYLRKAHDALIEACEESE